MTWKPLAGDRDPRRLEESLDRISASLGAPAASTLATIFDRWEDIVGPAVATHARPLSLLRGTLVIAVDQPGWATQLTYLDTDLRRRIDDVVGPGAVRRTRVTVRPT